jgi:RNA polymerase sigma-70 factor (ECF subfamily)
MRYDVKPAATSDALDVRLIARAQAGDAAALEVVLGSLAPAVHRFGLRMCRHADDADDVVQDALLEIARRLPQFEGRSSLSTWAFTIARTACARRRRGLKNQPTMSEEFAGDAVVDAPSPEDQVVRADLSERVDAALQHLSPEAREVLLLRDVEGLTAPEAAAAIGIEVGALKSRLHRARAALRAELMPLLEPAAARPGAGCPDVVGALSRKLEGELAAADCAQIEQHVVGCSACTTACDALRSVLASCRAQAKSGGPIPPHVQAQVRAAVKALLDERRGAAS